jgi:hypothetical protein
MKPSSGDKRLGLALPLERAAGQSIQTNNPSENEVGLDVSHPHLSEGRGEAFLLDILFHRMSVMGFHEKAGRSQVDSFWSLLVMLCLSSRVATLPSALFDERLFRSVQVGCSRFSRCCHLFVDLPFHLKNGSWARRLTQSPELGAWALYFLSKFMKPMLLPAAGPDCYCAAVRKPLRSPTTGVVKQRAFGPLQSPLASCHSSRHVRRASNPSHKFWFRF